MSRGRRLKTSLGLTDMCNPTKFEAQLWCPSWFGREEWVVIMLDGDEAGLPCAFGSKPAMEEYASRLNAQQGVLA
jgi:hypothetical protein